MHRRSRSAPARAAAALGLFAAGVAAADPGPPGAEPPAPAWAAPGNAAPAAPPWFTPTPGNAAPAAPPSFTPAAPSVDDAVFLDPAITGEAIVVWGERPDKPFDRDTERRLTGAELARRGATNLADALELLPDVVVREQGRGGRQVEIRGARKGSVKILIDGASISDPYYGNLDISSIPVTDIAEIRVSSSPASPIDGPGGPGGVVEVHTRDAIGPRRIAARALGSSLPAAEASATGRAPLAPHLALRVSASGALGLRDFDVMPPGDAAAAVAEDRRQAVGSVRLEYRRGRRRAAADGWAQSGGYVVPPGEESSRILVIDRETQARAGLTVDDQVGAWRLQGRGYGHLLRRDSRSYDDPALEDLASREDLEATRFGGALLTNRPLGPRVHVVGSAAIDRDQADVAGLDGDIASGSATLAELAAGLQLADGPWRLDGAAGLAAPLGVDASAWPEAKLTAVFAPVAPVSLKLIGGRKGRLPTLRERFRPDIGSEALGPEQVWFAESEVALRPAGWLDLRAAAYLRRSNGLIRLGTERRELVNLGRFDTRGVDASATLAPGPGHPLAAGATYSFTDAVSDETGTDALDFLPRHRATAWIEARLPRAGAQVRLRRQSRQIDRQATLPVRSLVDVNLWISLPGDLLASLRVDNAGGALYEERLGVPAPGRVLVLVVQGEWK